MFALMPCIYIHVYSTATCDSDEFTCDNRECIDQSYRCDQYDDCGDNSDEDGCGM